MIRKTALLIIVIPLFAHPRPVDAHPLGNFSVNRWAAIQPGAGWTHVDYVVDFAEIPTFQESPAIDADGDSRESEEEVRSFARMRAETFAAGLELNLDGQRLALRVVSSTLQFNPGAGGLRTMKLTALFEAPIPKAIPESGSQVTFRDGNFEGRAGWRELIAYGDSSSAVVNSSVPATDLSHALSSYPADSIQSPPQVAQGDFRLLTGNAAARARADGRAAVGAPDPSRQAEARPPLSDGLTRLMGPTSSGFGVGFLLAAFAGALFWGGAHALSPGHGKTVVAAYLVGQRGSPMHAVWLGLIVTFTHTIGVFALGALTLLLSRWFVPESLYPWLGLASGLTVTIMGVALLARRLRRVAFGSHTHAHGPDDHHHHAEGADEGHTHVPGGHTHELPERLSFKSLVALGVSGGIVPCPSALVVLLSAVAFHRILFGMALIVAFSVGLAAVLVAVGLLMVYARHLFDRFDAGGTLAGRLGLVSAATITLLGIGIAMRSLPQPFATVAAAALHSPWGATLGILGLGLLFGLKHATEADHLAAVSSIVSEQGGMRRALWTGGLWGAGHTFSILIAGLLVLGLHLVIPESVARWLEFGVALMIIGLGGTALARALKNRPGVHVHPHIHDFDRHAHLHFHGPDDHHLPALKDPDAAPAAAHQVHVLGRVGIKPLLVGMMHGLAGSAALTILVLAQIKSAIVGMVYLLVFGVGSIGGMALMSLVISLPFAATVSRPGMNRGVRVASGALSLAFGLFYAWGFRV